MQLSPHWWRALPCSGSFERWRRSRGRGTTRAIRDAALSVLALRAGFAGRFQSAGGVAAKRPDRWRTAPRGQFAKVADDLWHPVVLAPCPAAPSSIARCSASSARLIPQPMFLQDQTRALISGFRFGLSSRPSFADAMPIPRLPWPSPPVGFPDLRSFFRFISFLAGRHFHLHPAFSARLPAASWRDRMLRLCASVPFRARQWRVMSC